MRCPTCDAEIKENDPSFCPRCGASLGASEGEATTQLSASEVEAARSHEAVSNTQESTPHGEQRTKQIDAPVTKPEARSSRQPVVSDFVDSVKHSARREGAIHLLGAAAFIFLTMVATGALMALAAKLQYGFIGQGASPLSILSGLVITGMAVLRVPVHIGDLTVSLLPFGALAFVGYAAVWATARVVRRGHAVGLRSQVLDGTKVAVPLAIICWLAALVFRIDEGPSPVSADAAGALLFGALWGVVFGALGGLVATRPLRAHLRDLASMLKTRYRTLYEGLLAGGAMLAVTGGLAVFAGLIWVIVGLLDGRPAGDFGLGEAGAALIYLVAFGPNVIAAIVTVALGAPVEVGAQISSAGRLIGSVDEISLFSWGDGPPWFAFALLLVPTVGCLFGGYIARRNASDQGNVVQVLTIAAVVYAVVLFELAGLADARLGAGLVRARGFGKIAPDAATVALLGFAWAVVLGFVGWRVGEASVPSSEPDTAGAST